jgi:MFS family permease
VGALFAGYGLSRIFFTPLIGDFSDRYGRKWFIAAGLGIYTVVSLWYLIPGSIEELFVIRFIQGIASAMITTAAMAYVGDITPDGQEGAYQGRLQNAFYLGMGAGPLIGGAVYHVAGLAPVFLLMAGMALVPFILCIRYLPESRPVIRKRPRIRDAFVHPREQAILFFRFTSCFPYAAFMVFVPVIAATQYGYTTTLSGLVITIEVLSMGMTLGFYCGMADRYMRSHMIVGGTLLTCIATIAMPFVNHLAPVLLIAFLIGIGNAVAIAAATSVVAVDGKTIGQGVVMGAYNTVVSLGITIPPLIFGVILVWWGVDAVFILSGLIGIAALVPFWYLVLRSRRLVPPLRKPRTGG